MAKETLVEDLKRIEPALEESIGPISLLLAEPGESDKNWNVIISAKRFDNKRSAESVHAFTQLLKEWLKPTSWKSVLRTTVLATSDPFVLAVAAEARDHAGVYEIVGSTLAGIPIERAVVIHSSESDDGGRNKRNGRKVA